MRVDNNHALQHGRLSKDNIDYVVYIIHGLSRQETIVGSR